MPHAKFSILFFIYMLLCFVHLCVCLFLLNITAQQWGSGWSKKQEREMHRKSCCSGSLFPGPSQVSIGEQGRSPLQRGPKQAAGVLYAQPAHWTCPTSVSPRLAARGQWCSEAGMCLSLDFCFISSPRVLPRSLSPATVPNRLGCAPAQPCHAQIANRLVPHGEGQELWIPLVYCPGWPSVWKRPVVHYHLFLLSWVVLVFTVQLWVGALTLSQAILKPDPVIKFIGTLHERPCSFFPFFCFLLAYSLRGFPSRSLYIRYFCLSFFLIKVKMFFKNATRLDRTQPNWS